MTRNLELIDLPVREAERLVELIDRLRVAAGRRAEVSDDETAIVLGLRLWVDDWKASQENA